MNKKGVAEGISWFFAIIVTALLLILFYITSSFFFLPVQENRGEIYLGDFYKQDSLRQLILMEDYSHVGVYNNFSYEIFGANYAFLVTDPFAVFLNIISREIFSKSNGRVSPAYLTFNFGSKHIDWSLNGMVLVDNFDVTDSEGIVSKLDQQGIKVSYQNIWDYVPGEISFNLSSDGRLYRVYFETKGMGFARFGISAVQR
ncbi:Uncharacterised protein [uncultured archaeon]|nr:Uncharacterised protein [uncultured archaeon]